MFKIAKNKNKNLCSAFRCGRPRKSKDRFCSKHRHRYNKHNDPEAYTFNLLRSNARRRGKVFTITLEYFRAFCDFTDYIELKGRKSKCLSVDRKDPLKGYEPGNLQPLTVSQNSCKAQQDKEIINEVPF